MLGRRRRAASILAAAAARPPPCISDPSSSRGSHQSRIFRRSASPRTGGALSSTSMARFLTSGRCSCAAFSSETGRSVNNRCFAIPRTSVQCGSCVYVPRRIDLSIKSRRFSIAAAVSLQNDSSVTRNARVKAQKALFEYLHSTRGLQFADAEHLSNNSPVFLESLLSKIENDTDVGQSLRRFLRFHPINEFEPFFESIGIEPSEISPLLPRNLMYLADDSVLLENYHALSNYGVPRGKIGRLYKEVSELFHHEHGVLINKMHAYESLGFPKLTTIKLVTCCPTLLVGEVGVRVVEKLRGLGVELDRLRGFLSGGGAHSLERILKMLDLFDRMGFDKENLGLLIRDYPKFVFDDSDKVYSLIAVLLKLGLEMDHILTVFVRFPRILVGNFVRNLYNSILFLTEIGMETEEIARIVLSHPQVLSSCHCFTPSYVLRKLSISDESLCSIIKNDPSQFSRLVSKKKNGLRYWKKADNKSHAEKTNFLLKLGFSENSDEMAKALSTFRGRGDQLQGRFDCLVETGLDYNTVIRMIKSYPQVLNQSVDVIRKKINFLLNDIGYSLEEIAKFPGFLCYTVEKIKARCLMQKWVVENREHLLDKGSRTMHSSGAALSSILACSDARFVRYVVDLHPDGPKEWERLKNSELSH